ncbi:ricin-type beta-trefoil lectin domain protein [Paractinoplanes durhamensis]|uniref:ricin-type beta-trefoil lectin domain protein n=1 Tax=Paractinoplanes durhamensis TaxID=113563 RepID=UPI001942E5FD|nr:ricin-type beta-trefoil lectin domain protein [Actinoplanes durhamensis]
MALSLGVPPGAVPEGGGWPLSGLFSVLRQTPVLAAVAGLPKQEIGGDPADADHYVPTSETKSDGGAGRAPGRGKGIADPALPTQPESQAYTTPAKPGDGTSFDPQTSERLPKSSSATYDEFQNEDGSITRQIHESRVNFRAPDGTYQPIDSALTPRGNRLEAGANSIEVSLGARGADVSKPAPTATPSVEPSTAPSATPSPAPTVDAGSALASVTTASGHTMAYDLAGAAAVPAVVDGDTATYPEILPGTDLELRSLNDGLKETIVLKSPAAGNEWLFPLKLEGLTPKAQPDGSIDLLTAAGAVAMRVPQGYMQDSKVDPASGAPAESSKVHYELTTVDGSPALRVTADAAWLADPARQYPVRIDPTAEWQTADTGDVFTDNSSSTANQDGDNLPVGTYDGGTTVSRSFIHFDNFDNDGLVGTQIRSAKLFAYHTWSYNCTSHEPVYVRRVTSSWTVNNLGDNGTLAAGPSYSSPIATWTIGDNYPACENTGSNRGVGAFRSVALPVTTFNGWSSGTMPNFGLALTASESDSTAFKRFTSGDYGVATDPYLELTYDYNVDAQVDEQYPAYGAAAQTLTPELIADAHDPDNWPKTLTYKFILYGKDSKTEIANSGWIAKKSWTVPAGKMVWGESYYWTAMVSDGLTNNADFLSKHLLVTPVPQPSVTSGLSQNPGQGFDPVIGNYTTTIRDVMVATIGPPLEITRAYNSIDPRTDQALGVGWSSVLDAKAVEKTATIGGTTSVNTVVVTYPNGREMAFGRNNDSTFLSPAGLSATFTKLGTGYRLREKEGTTYVFAEPTGDGRYGISSITDVSGRTQTFWYTDHVVSTIESASGRILDVFWTSTTPKRVDHISTDASVVGDWDTVNTWWYDYSADGALEHVCPPAGGGECRDYEYAATGSPYPTTMLNARPYSYWRLTETAGAVANSSMLENGGTDLGTYSGVALGQPGPLAGSSATAAGFNGTSAQLQLPAKLSTDATNQAISMWFKASGGDGVLYGQSLEATSSAAATTRTAYHPTLYVGSNGKLMGGFPKAPKLGASLGTLLAAGQGQCLTVPYNSSLNGLVLVLSDCTGGPSQVFTWTTGRQIQVTSGGVVKCLDTQDQGGSNGDDLIINSCNSTYATQKWDVQVDGQITNDYSGLCLDSVGDGSQSGAAMQIWACGKTRPVDQLFTAAVHSPMESAASVADGNWHHVVLSASGNKQEMYVDDKPVITQTGVTVQDLSPNSSYIGKGFLGGGWPNQSHASTASNLGYRDYFTGSVAEVALFDSAVDKQVVNALLAARGAVKQMTRIVRANGGSNATVTYDGVTGRVSEMTDGNGTLWKPQAPVLGGTTKVYESAVLGGAPTNYWRMAESNGGQDAVNQVNGGVATYNVVGLGSLDGPFGAAGKAGSFNGTSSYLSLPSGVATKNSSSVSMWFNTTTTRKILLGTKYDATQNTARYDIPAMWISADGRLRALSPSKTPTGPLNSVGIPGKCIDVEGSVVTDGTKIQIYTCNGTAAQNWSLVPLNASNTEFTLQAFGKCITPNGGFTANGTVLTLWTCNGTATQTWQSASGRILNKLSGRCIDDPGSSKVDGTDLQLYDCSTSVAQQWMPSLSSKAVVNDGKWHHAVLTTDGLNQSLYVDGVKTQSSAASTVTTQRREMDPDTAATYTAGAGYVDGGTGNFYWLDSNVTSYHNGGLAEVATYASTIDDNQASYQFKARDAVKAAPSGEIQYSILGPPDGNKQETKTTTVNDLMYGRKVADIDALGNATRYGYSGKGNLRTVTDANGNMTINEHDARGNVVAATTCQDRSANQCSTSYSTYYLNASDPADVRNDRLLELRGPGSASVTDNTYLTKYTYDASGNRTSEIDAIGRTTTIGYTDGSTTGGYAGAQVPAGLPWKVIKPDGGVQTIEYNQAGDVAETTDPAGSVTRYEYDNLGRTTKELEVLPDPAHPGQAIIGATTDYEHDRSDRVTKVTDTPATNLVSGAVHTPVTTLAYDLDGQLTDETTTDATGGDAPRTTHYGYDWYGRRMTETDEVGNWTWYDYDAFGRVSKQTHADMSVELTTYDAVGNELATIVENGDGDADLTVRSLAYDPGGRLASETDAMGWVTKYTYTDNNLIATVTRTNGSESFVLERNTYDAAGNRTVQLSNNGLTKTTYTYDEVGRGRTATVEVTDPDEGSVTSRTTTYAYSAEDDVVSTTLTAGGAVPSPSDAQLSRSDTMYDRMGRVQQETTYLTGGLTPTTRWRMDQTSGTTTADAAGNNTGTAAGAVNWSPERGGAASFTGVTGSAIVGQAAVDTLRPYTLSLWAKLAAKDADHYVAAMSGDNGATALDVFYDKAADSWRLAMDVRQPDGTNASVTSTSTTGSATQAWQHLAVVVTPATTSGATSTAQLYVDGTVTAAISTTTEQFNNRATDLRIGAGIAPPGEFTGLVDDVQTYQQALSATEIGQLHTGAAPADAGRVSRTSYTLTSDGSVTAMTDPKGGRTEIVNDEVGRPVTTTRPAVSTVVGEGAPVLARPVTRVGYNTFGEATEQQDANGNITINRYDGAGQMVESESPQYTLPGTTTKIKAIKTVTYNTVGQVASTTDALGAQTTYEYDLLGRTVKVTAPDEGVTEYEYTGNGDLASNTDPNGSTVASTYDYLGRTLSSTSAVRQDNAGYTTTYDYASSPWPTKVTSPGNVVTTAKYNSVGEVTRVSDILGNTTTTKYDGAGRPIRTTAADNTYTTVTYDFAGRQTATADWSAAGTQLRTRTQEYDTSGNPVAATDARGTRKTYTYDLLGRLTGQREPISSADAIDTTFGYDLAGNQTRFTDGRGNGFVTTYNEWGLPATQIEPATTRTPNAADRTFTLTYNKNGKSTRLDSPGGVSVTSDYDVMGRLVKSSGSGAQATTTDRTFEYDQVGRMTKFTGSAGANTVGYDDRGLVTSITGVSGASSYQYNPDGLLTGRTDGAGTTAYQYDPVGRPSRVQNTAAGVDMTYGYNSLSQVQTIAYGGNTRTFGYNDLHQQTSDELKTSNQTSIGKIAYEWNLNDSLTKKTTTGFGGVSVNTYTYDLADRLSGWDDGTTPVVYAYDKSGNRVQAGTKTFTYDQRNQLVSESAGTTYQYTARGTLTATTTGGQTVNTVTDAFNQVISQGAGSTYTYDGLGRVIQTGLTYTGLGNDVAADGTSVYVRDTADSLVGVTSAAGQRYAWTDAHTDVVGEFTATGAALTGSVSYDPFGKVLAAAGMTGRLGYQQEWTDQTTGKVNMWSRWYDPQTGTFDTRDTAANSASPTSGAANRFAYAEGDPLSNTDTSGNAVDGKCGEYDYACEVKKYQAELSSYTSAMDQRDRDMQAVGGQIAAQEADYQRSQRESQTSLLDILLQVGVGMLLDMIGYTSLVGCLGGSIWDCVDLATNFLGPIKALKMAKSLYKAADRAFSGYRLWKRIVDGAMTVMHRSQDLINVARKHLGDIMKKVPKKPKPPKKKVKPPAKKKPKPKPKPERKPQPSKQAKQAKPKTEPKNEKKPAQTKAAKPKEQNNQPDRKKQPQKHDEDAEETGQQACPTSPATSAHSFDPDTRVLMADGTTRPISEITIGDQVQAKDPITGEAGARQVTLLHANRDHELTDITISARPDADADADVVSEGKGGRSTRGPTGTSVLQTTAHHPFWDATTGRWTDAANLKAGKSTLTGPDGRIQHVTAVRNHTGATVMRDLTVDDIHTYYVIAGNTPVLVHNCGGDTPAPSMHDTAIGPVDANGVGPTTLPRVEFDSSKMPNIAANVRAAQASGKPMVLNRTTIKADIDANRAAACAGFCGRPLSPDEYPLASSMQGGAGARILGVPIQEQRIQGGVMSSFYRKFSIGHGDPFEVVVK